MRSPGKYHLTHLLILALLSLVLTACKSAESKTTCEFITDCEFLWLRVDPRQVSQETFLEYVSDAFDRTAEYLGSDFTGKLLEKQLLDQTGNPMRIYENIGMWVDLSNPDRVLWVRIPDAIDLRPSHYVEDNRDPQMVFWPVQGDKLGHNVLLAFYDYILRHGGPDVSGPPITTYFFPEDQPQVVRQCFENLCLDYDGANNPKDPVSVFPLGEIYCNRFCDNLPPVSTPTMLEMLIQQTAPYIAPDEGQEITVYLSLDNMPASGISPTLEIFNPDKTVSRFPMPATDEKGKSTIWLEATHAPNASVFPYQVCVIQPNGSGFCGKEQFMVWVEP